MHQPSTPPQRLQIPQLRHIIPRQHQRLQIRQRLRDIRRDVPYSIPRQQQRRQSWREREVGERGDVVVGEVDCVVRASDAEVFDAGDFVACLCTRGARGLMEL
jgi:hypothetical protein